MSNVWQFFKGRLPFRRSIVKTAVFAVIALFRVKGFWTTKVHLPTRFMRS
ncbi:MAG: hypothetical protein OCU20_02995 [Methanophagales archaeon]|nr:hypothetical protein [Methanophagales archaeon]MCW7072851.1 hypothetical protein [Methanophagales archaeon]